MTKITTGRNNLPPPLLSLLLILSMLLLPSFKTGTPKLSSFAFLMYYPTSIFCFVMNVRNWEVVCKDEGREDEKAITSCQLSQEVVEVPFPQHFCPFFFITIMVAALLITQHISLHYQLRWWGWWWVLFTAGILWRALQMNNNYSNRYVEAKKDKWLQWSYCVPERQGGDFFEKERGLMVLSQKPSILQCWAGPAYLRYSVWKTMIHLNHQTNAWAHCHPSFICQGESKTFVGSTLKKSLITNPFLTALHPCVQRSTYLEQPC